MVPYMEHVCALEFGEEPSYEYLLSLFEEGMELISTESDSNQSKETPAEAQLQTEL